MHTQDTQPKRSITTRWSEAEISELQRAAEEHHVTVSEILRQALAAWHVSDKARRRALDRWTDALLDKHGLDAKLTITYDEMMLLDRRTVVGAPRVTGDGSGVVVTINDEDPGSGVVGRAAPKATDPTRLWDVDRVELWLADPDSGVGCLLGFVPAIDGAAITMPLEGLRRAADQTPETTLA